MNYLKFVLFGASILVAASSCVKSIDYAGEEKKKRDEFLQTNGITQEPTETGLYVVPQDSGTGLQPIEGDTVFINYIASYLNLVVFDTNIEEVAKQYNLYNPSLTYEPLKFIVGDKTVIAGIDEGVRYMREGGSVMLVIPSDLAYQNYETLLFYLELVDVKPAYDTSAVR